MNDIEAYRMTFIESMLCRIFGKKVVTEDSGFVLIGYYWRGKFYLTQWIEP